MKISVKEMAKIAFDRMAKERDIGCYSDREKSFWIGGYETALVSVKNGKGKDKEVKK